MPLALWVSTESMFRIRLFICLPTSQGVVSPRFESTGSLYVHPGHRGGLWMWRQKSGATPSFGAVQDRIDDSLPEGQGKEVFVVINFTQETQHVALPHQMRALRSGV